MASPTQTREELAPAEPDGGGGIDFREYLRVLWAYKWVILGVAVAIATAVIFWTLSQPKIYEATCTIEDDPSPPRPLGSQVEDVANPLGNFWTSREFFATQNQIISSRTVAERVVRELALHQDASFFYVDPEEHRRPSFLRSALVSMGLMEPVRPWQGATVEAAARALQSRMVVEPVEETRLVAIRVSDRNPERAATLANAIAEAYIEKTLEDRMGSTVSALEWLGNQLDSLRNQLDESELALHHFKQEHNVLSVSMEDRQNLVASDIQRFSEALTKARTRRIELSARLARIRSIAEGPTPEDAAAAFAENEAIAVLRGQLREKVAEQQGLQSRYGPNHQRMQQLGAEIEDLRGQLRRELAGIVRAADADVREIRQVEGGIRSALDEVHHQGLELNLREIEYSRLNRARENNSKLYTLVLERTTETDLTRMLRTTHARLLDRALRPTAPISPKFTTNAAGGVGVGLALGLALAFLLSRLDRRVRSVADAETLGLTILGILPRIDEGDEAQPASGKKRRRRVPPVRPGLRDLFVHTHPMSAAAECCRTIRTNLTFMSADQPIRALVITSANPREGKTTVTTNIAVSLAQSGKRVLIVDTDLRRPRIHRAFGVSGQRGVTSVVVGELALEDAVASTDIPGLDILPCGPIPPNPSELLHSAKFGDLVKEALKRYDRVIFDSPPLGAVTDAAVLAPQVDAALVVIKAQHTTRDAITSALRQLRDVGANVVGGVLNDVDPRRKGYGASDYYYYYRREGYYAADEDEAGGGPSERPNAPPPS